MKTTGLQQNNEHIGELMPYQCVRYGIILVRNLASPSTCSRFVTQFHGMPMPTVDGKQNSAHPSSGSAKGNVGHISCLRCRIFFRFQIWWDIPLSGTKCMVYILPAGQRVLEISSDVNATDFMLVLIPHYCSLYST